MIDPQTTPAPPAVRVTQGQNPLTAKEAELMRLLHICMRQEYEAGFQAGRMASTTK